MAHIPLEELAKFFEHAPSCESFVDDCMEFTEHGIETSEVQQFFKEWFYYAKDQSIPKETLIEGLNSLLKAAWYNADILTPLQKRGLIDFLVGLKLPLLM